VAPGVDTARGVVLDDRYRLDEVIGQGGMATVYRAHDLVLDRDVAIKLFPPVAEDADELLRHQAEMRVLAQMSHPGLVTLHDAGSSYAGGPMPQTYLVMELVNGPTLAECLTTGPMPAQHVALLGRQIAEALAVVHAADVVHRDIKPANVLLVDPDGIDADPAEAPGTGPLVKLADFGIARLSDGARLTVTGTTLGTATYLSPEQAAGATVGPPTDVYALGLVLLECLTGRKAFTGTIVEVAAARLNTAPPIPAELGRAWRSLLERMTRRAPADRPTAAEVAVRLTAILQGGSDVAATPRWWGRERRRTLPGPLNLLPPSWGLGSREGDTGDRPEPFGRRATDTGQAPAEVRDDGVGAVDRQDGTRVYSTADLLAAVGRGGREGGQNPERDRAEGETDDDAAEPRTRRRSVWAAAVALAVVLLTGAALVSTTQDGTTDPDPAPTYPRVVGSLGSALHDLQKSVEP
jgi:tRNA A-37 threonylcarbamoyl transferase component Bud32